MLNVVQSLAFVADLKNPLPLRFVEQRVEGVGAGGGGGWQQISGTLFWSARLP